MDLVNTFIGAAAINAHTEQANKAAEQNLALKNKENQLRDVDSVMSVQRQRIDSLEARSKIPPAPSKQELDLRKKVQILEEEIKEFKGLLAKPMLEIATESGEFQKTYQKQQSKFAEWIISQRAYKELAMKYGKELGKDIQEVEKDSENAKEIVIQNKSEFNNHVEPKIVADLNHEETMRLRREHSDKVREERDKIIREKFGVKS